MSENNKSANSLSRRDLVYGATGAAVGAFALGTSERVNAADPTEYQPTPDNPAA